MLKQIDLVTAMSLVAKGDLVKCLVPGCRGDWKDMQPGYLNDYLDGMIFLLECETDADSAQGDQENGGIPETTQESRDPEEAHKATQENQKTEKTCETTQDDQKPEKAHKTTGEGVRHAYPGNRKILDDGKIKALRVAGWSIDKIADEMGVSGPTIRKRLKEIVEAGNDKDDRDHTDDTAD